MIESSCLHGWALFLDLVFFASRQPRDVAAFKIQAAAGGRAESVSDGVSSGDSSLSRVKSADWIILFIGNSHTTLHDLPELVCNMIRFRHPGKTAYQHTLCVSFLEDAAHDPRCQLEIAARPWIGKGDSHYCVFASNARQKGEPLLYIRFQGSAMCANGARQYTMALPGCAALGQASEFSLHHAISDVHTHSHKAFQKEILRHANVEGVRLLDVPVEPATAGSALTRLRGLPRYFGQGTFCSCQSAPSAPWTHRRPLRLLST